MNFFCIKTQNDMEFIDYKSLEERTAELKSAWNNAEPFHRIVFDDFFTNEAAEKILATYPEVEEGAWESKTFLNQKNKFVKTNFDDNPVLQQAFDEINGQKLLDIVQNITGIKNVKGDPKLFGGGLHQSINGAFLDVHLDFNIHPVTKKHRRMNIIIYMNKDWKEEYGGFLELWDMDKKEQIGNVAPSFNRCVIFETNKVSFHGHPKPINTPKGISRKSLATYFYTENRPANEIENDRNTLYVNTEGMTGNLKNFKSGVKAFFERVTEVVDNF